MYNYKIIQVCYRKNQSLNTMGSLALVRNFHFQLVFLRITKEDPLGAWLGHETVTKELNFVGTQGWCPSPSSPQRQLGRYMATLPNVNPGAPHTRFADAAAPRRAAAVAVAASHDDAKLSADAWSHERVAPRSIASPRQLCMGSFRALYIPETLAGRPCIYLRIEIYRADRPAARVPFTPSDPGFRFRTRSSEMRWANPPAPLEFEYRYFGGWGSGGRSGQADRRNFPPSSSWWNENKCQRLIFPRARARQQRIKNRPPPILFSLHNVSIILPRFVFRGAGASRLSIDLNGRSIPERVSRWYKNTEGMMLFNCVHTPVRGLSQS